MAFFLRSARGERLAGLAVVLAIFVSACVALVETILRLIHPEHLSHLGVLAAAGAVGFIGNEIAAQVRGRAGKRWAAQGSSPTALTHVLTDSSPWAWWQVRSRSHSALRSQTR